MRLLAEKPQLSAPEIFIIEDDPILSQLFFKNLQKRLNRFSQAYQIRCFTNVIDTISALPNGCTLPVLIILDIILVGPDGFMLLNELASFSDLSKVPVIIVSSLQLPASILDSYNVIKVLDKTTMYPTELCDVVQKTLTKNSSGQAYGRSQN